MLKLKVCRLRTLNFGGGWSIRYQLPWPAIKACTWIIARKRGSKIPCRPHPAAIELVNVNDVRVISFERNNAKINDIFLTAYKFHRKNINIHQKTDCFDEKLKNTVEMHYILNILIFSMQCIYYCDFQFFVKTVCFYVY